MHAIFLICSHCDCLVLICNALHVYQVNFTSLLVTLAIKIQLKRQELFNIIQDVAENDVKPETRKNINRKKITCVLLILVKAG